jgi:hypothetical protein
MRGRRDETQRDPYEGEARKGGFLQNMEMENIDAADEGKNKLISRRNSAYFTELDRRNRVTLIRVIRF